MFWRQNNEQQNNYNLSDPVKTDQHLPCTVQTVGNLRLRVEERDTVGADLGNQREKWESMEKKNIKKKKKTKRSNNHWFYKIKLMCYSKR